MPWLTINKILTLAMIDPQFARKLLANPIGAIHESGFEITPKEAQILQEAHVQDISELSQFLLARLGSEEQDE